ncbi:SO_0444 family Cu/Zn efflux transporter [Pseudoalteromonas sp. MMG022]|uniref:SO_0444 family Cu/Zn efflux transporter n=1 Tax=Pseudoalteromonas sp. MMG022 TaxID=2909978 RepID=UPI001F1F6425|nr:SO_0444 family Cu/Zn efflux transporter [Pseudoalteromonas sp. MMG022]MCF6436830.1 SO_0444 family Cu/Zn efflux transporter [Pseudoalteromonas sp. MMG022]
MELVTNFWQLFLLSAPWLILGLFLAGVINVFIAKDFLQRHLGEEGVWTTVKAALIGAPMPLCSCGVIPAAIGLRRAGGSKSATTAFLVSTPETGVDSISVSYVLLGPFMAIIRPIAAVCSAIVAGVLVGGDTKSQSPTTHKPTTQGCCDSEPAVAASSCCNTEQEQASTQTSCCATQHQASQSATCCDTKATVAKQSCCDTQDTPQESFLGKMWRAIKFSSNKLLSDTMVWLMIGLFFAAVVQTFVPESFLSQWGGGIIAMMVVILISIPMYICATASTPIAAGLLMAGVSPGAVLVFMLAGPATNIATLGVVGKELGKRAVIAYLGGVIGVAIIFGFLTDFLVASYGFAVEPMVQMQHEILPQWFTLLTGLVLLALMLRLVCLDVWQKVAGK